MLKLASLLTMLSEQEIDSLLTDLLTPKEIAALEERWQIAQLLQQGKTYRAVGEQLGVSTTTVTRVARAMETGKGYKAALVHCE